MGTARATDSIGALTYRSDADGLAEALAELPQLDASGLNRRWRSLVGGPIPQDLGRPLVLRMLAYKVQAQRLGDLDKVSQRELATVYVGSGEKGGGARARGKRPSAEDSAKAMSANPDTGITRPRLARPGTLLAREHNGAMHRVKVLDQGVSWNGKIYESLSKVAFAITGTRWNGPRFFGLRDKAKGDASLLQKPKAPPADAVIGRGRATRSGRPASRGASP